MIVRPERSGDEADISRVTEAAFRNMAFSDQTEHLIVGRLRQAGALVVSLVAEHGDEIIGHVGFSPVTLSSGEAGWFALGPLSVLPENQGQGVGAALVRSGLSALDGMGAWAVYLREIRPITDASVSPMWPVSRVTAFPTNI